jgi:23S rRNA-/tRNA-specific pseudouridylate synthase
MSEFIEETEADEEELFEHYRFKADPGQEVIRIDKFLIDRMPNTSRNKVQVAAKSGNILVNEQKAEKITPTSEQSSDSQGTSFQLTTQQPDNLKTQLLELSLKNKLNIVSLQSETNSLENIFRNLTSHKHTK